MQATVYPMPCAPDESTAAAFGSRVRVAISINPSGKVEHPSDTSEIHATGRRMGSVITISSATNMQLQERIVTAAAPRSKREVIHGTKKDDAVPTMANTPPITPPSCAEPPDSTMIFGAQVIKQ